MISREILFTASLVAAGELYCKPSVDLYFALDNTNYQGTLKQGMPLTAQSFYDNFTELHELNDFTQHNRIGFIQYRDRNYKEPAQDEVQWCSRLLGPFNYENEFDEARSSLKTYPLRAVEDKVASYRDVYGALIKALRADKLWRPISTDGNDLLSQASLRVIVLVTNAVPHSKGDETVGEVSSDYPPDPENYTDDFVCQHCDYALASDLTNNLLQHNTSLVVLTNHDEVLDIYNNLVNTEGLPFSRVDTMDLLGNTVVTRAIESIREVVNHFCETSTTTTTTTTTTNTATEESEKVKECKSLIKGVSHYNDEGCQILCAWYGGNGGIQCGTMPRTAAEVVECATRLNTWCTER